jgi:predicted nucleic acid-binding protein
VAAAVEFVLVDTSVWIDTFRNPRSPYINYVRSLIEENRAVTCGPVSYEIRSGLREPERKTVLPLFAELLRLPTLDQDWDEAGELRARLRRSGFTLPSLDALIAHLCLRHEVALCTLDAHFKHVPGLRLTAPLTASSAP